MPPETIIAAPAAWPGHWDVPLQERGFVRDGRVHCLEGITFSVSGRWLVFAEQANGVEGKTSTMGEPGLWKLVQNGGPRRVFEIPAWTVSEQPEEERLDESGLVAFGKLVDWALQTRSRQAPPEWIAPDAEVVQSWIPQGALTVQRKGYVRQGELILSAKRWALRMAILPEVEANLPEARGRALAELIEDAQSHWKMARIGFLTEGNLLTLAAEVDLTGAPHSELLFSSGLDVLKHVAAWLVEIAEVLADPAIAIESLTLDAITPQAKRKELA